MTGNSVFYCWGEVWEWPIFQTKSFKKCLDRSVVEDEKMKNMIFVCRKMTKNDCLVAKDVDFGGEVWK